MRKSSRYQKENTRQRPNLADALDAPANPCGPQLEDRPRSVAKTPIPVSEEIQASGRLAAGPMPADAIGLQMLTVHQAAEILQISSRQIRRLIERGECPAVQIGRTIRIPVTGLREFVQKQRAGK